MAVKLVREISSHQLEWRNDPRIYATCRQSHLLSHAEHKEWLKKIAQPDTEMFGIEVEGVGLVGTCGLTHIRRDHQTAEYSLLIGPPYQQKGYAQKGLSLLLDWAFREQSFEVIWGEIFDFNKAGLAIARKLGFLTEGILRCRYQKKERRVHTYMVSLLKEEWLSRS